MALVIYIYGDIFAIFNLIKFDFIELHAYLCN